MANWNCARLAESLIPLIHDDDEQAVSLMTPHINSFAELFNIEFTAMWAQKLGLAKADIDDSDLIGELLKLLKDHQLDYTNTFDALTESLKYKATVPDVLAQWAIKWHHRTDENSYQTMRQANPRAIPRNHIIEKIITEYNEFGSSDVLNRFTKVINNPYLASEELLEFQVVPESDNGYRTFCGT
jgi:uncharacterized protein YdiU (UPF0061 family)